MLALPLIAAAPSVPPDAGACGTRLADVPNPASPRSLREGLINVPKNRPTKFTTPHIASETMDKRNQLRFSATEPSDKTYGITLRSRAECVRPSIAFNPRFDDC